MAETWSTVDERVKAQAAAAAKGGNPVPIQAPGNPNAGTLGGTTKRRVHCWTGDPTWRRHISRDKDKDAATKHAGSDEVKEIPYISALVDFLKSAHPTIDYLDFHTHGAAGFIAFEKTGAESKNEGGKDVVVKTEDGLGWVNLFRL